ncbi:TPA: carbohydrate kinase [Staphylococcus aureus]
MRRLFSIGEALIDFIPNITNANLKDVQTFTKQIGGAPCNVACTVQKLGQQAHMITQLGNDAFGDSIIETISSIGVDVSKVYRTNEANTALAFVSLTEAGERDFSFYRKPSADMLFEPSFVNDIDVNENDVVHFCSVDLIDSPMREAHYQLITKTLNSNGTVVFDPNVRLPLWDNAEDLRQTIHTFLPLAHIVKVSDNVTVVIYTKGADGAAVYLKNGNNHYHSGYKVKPVDTTGAGDAFIGAVISRILATDVLNLTQLFENEGEEILAFSNRVAAIVTTKYGAIISLPTLQEVEQAF